VTTTNYDQRVKQFKESVQEKKNKLMMKQYAVKASGKASLNTSQPSQHLDVSYESGGGIFQMKLQPIDISCYGSDTNNPTPNKLLVMQNATIVSQEEEDSERMLMGMMVDGE
jgi:hypothetical protein